MRRFPLLLLVLLLTGLSPAEPLKIGLVGTAPFLIWQDGKPEGVDIRLWRDVATRLELEYDFHQIKSVSDGIGALARGELDMLIGGIVITAERERVVDFSQPYYRTGAAILSPAHDSPWDRLRPILRQAVIYAILGFLGGLLMVGTLLWLAEKKVNHLQFSSDPVRGIATGIWLALVTMSTVGYGDRVPVTLPGRIVAAIWMLLSMLFASSIVAGIASSLTVSQIGVTQLEKPQDLIGLRISSVRGTYYEDLVRRYTNRVVLRNRLDEAIAAVLEGDADCVVYDQPALRYFMHRFPEMPLNLSDVPFEAQTFGWAMRTNFHLSDKINVALLDEIESGRLSIIEQEYMAR